MADPNDSENHGKVSDSAYSNSCSNSQSRRSHSSKSNIHSGSNSSGSSGYGGNPSSGSSGSKSHPKRIKDKEPKKECKKKLRVEEKVEETPSPVQNCSSDGLEIPKAELGTAVATVSGIRPLPPNESTELTQASSNIEENGFSCVVSYDEGIIIYSTLRMYSMLGYPKEMWIGRNFIDFIHTMDQGIFAAQMSARFGLTFPASQPNSSESDPRPSVHCRLRRYNGLANSGFGIKNMKMNFVTCKLYLSLKEICDDEVQIFMVIQVIPVISMYRAPMENMCTSQKFMINHNAAGEFEYVDPASVPYLGYLPHLLVGKSAIELYHPEDLPYLRSIYESMLKYGKAPKSSYRMLIQNGDYVRVETEWTCFVNPWSRKLEFVSGHHLVIEGPCNWNIFESADPDRSLLLNSKIGHSAAVMRAEILKILSDVRTKPAEIAKQQMMQKCHNISSFMDKLIDENPKRETEFRAEVNDQDKTVSERDSVLLGGVSPHHDLYDSMSSSTEAPSYNQLNYRENLQRFFDSKPDNNKYDLIFERSVDEQPLADLRSYTPMPESASCYDESSLTDLGSEPRMSPSSNLPTLTESALVKHNHEMEHVLAKVHREARKQDMKTTVYCMRPKDMAKTKEAFQHPAQTSQFEPHGIKRHGPPTMVTNRKQRREMAPSDHMTEPNHHSSVANVIHHPSPSNWPVFPITAMDTIPSREFTNLGIPATDNQSHMAMKLGLDQTRPNLVFSNVQTNHPHMVTPTMAPMIRHPMPGSRRTFTQLNAGLTTTTNLQGSTNIAYSTASLPVQLISHPLSLESQQIRREPVYASRPVKWAGHAIENIVMHPQTFINTCIPMVVEDRRSHWSAGSSMTAPRHSIPYTATAGKYVEPVYPADVVITAACTMYTSYNGRCNYSSELSSKNTDPASSSYITANNDPNSSSDQTDRNEAETNSSFYSSFLKTESGSAEDRSSSDKDFMARNRSKCLKWVRGQSTTTFGDDGMPLKKEGKPGCYGKRRPRPAWMEQISPASSLNYRYKVPLKSKKEILEADKKFLAQSSQSEEVNKQLSQLYVDLQLQGVTSRLCLEEGITSSGSSSEDASSNTNTHIKKRNPYSKLVVIYEEDAPFPPSDEHSLQASSIGEEPTMPDYSATTALSLKRITQPSTFPPQTSKLTVSSPSEKTNTQDGMHMSTTVTSTLYKTVIKAHSTLPTTPLNPTVIPNISYVQSLYEIVTKKQSPSNTDVPKILISSPAP